MAEEFKVVKPMVLSKEMEKDFDELGKSVRESFAEHREKEINELLKEYNLTHETLQKSNYILIIERRPEGECVVLAERRRTKGLTTIESFIDQIMPKNI